MKISKAKARKLGNWMKIDWKKVKFKQFWLGVNIELEHAKTVNCHLPTVARIALDHIAEIPDYYDRLIKMEKKAGVSGIYSLIGMEWRSPKGTRKVVGRLPDGRYLVKYITGQFSNSNSAEIHDKENVLFEKKKDEHNLAYKEKLKTEGKRLRAEYEREHGVLLKYLNSLDKSSMQKKRIEIILKVNMVINGKLAPRWKHIVDLVEKGYRVHGKELQAPSGSFFFQKDLTKTAFDFAKWLKSQLGLGGLDIWGHLQHLPRRYK